MKRLIGPIVVKLFTCIAGLFLLTTVVVFPIVATILGYRYEETEELWMWLWILSFFFGLILIVTILIVKQPNSKEVAEKIAMRFDSYKSLESYLNHNLKETGYTRIPSQEQAPDLEVILYVKSTKLWELDCIAIIRATQLSSELLSQSNTVISELIKIHTRGAYIAETINMISLFCVDRITPALKKLVDSPAQQGIKNGRLPVGISFGGKAIYIPKRGEGLAIARYYRLKKIIMDVFIIDQSTRTR